ncbi:hypothetical protein SNEBB_007373 [Seison nebaliae]|nr:hypothetical protein SNEBB_007373 [Seison nebaliae]
MLSFILFNSLVVMGIWARDINHVSIELREFITEIKLEEIDQFCGQVDKDTTDLLKTDEYVYLGDFQDLRPYSLCPFYTPKVLLSDKSAVMVLRGKCNITDKMREIQEHYGSNILTLIIVTTQRFQPEHDLTVNITNLTIISIYKETIEPIVTVLIDNRTEMEMTKMFVKGIEDVPNINAAVFMVGTLAALCVLYGSLWGYKEEKHYLLDYDEYKKGNTEQKSETVNVNENAITDGAVKKMKKVLRKKRKVYSDFSSWMVAKFPSGWPRVERGAPIFMIAIMLLALISLYYVYDYTIWFFITVFWLTAPASLCRSIMFLLTFDRRAKHRADRHLFLRKSINVCPFHFSVLELILIIICYLLGIIWIVFKNDNYIWILHSIFAFSLAADIIRATKIRSFKFITIMMLIAVSFDIFMNHITPFFTREGTSVKEYLLVGPAAEGIDTVEQLSIVFRIPFLPTPHKCLGTLEEVIFLVDVIVPGIGVASTGIWGILTRRKWDIVFFCVAFVSYASALIGVLILKYHITYFAHLGIILPVLWISCAIYLLVTKQFKNYWNADPYNDIIVSEGHTTYDTYEVTDADE